MPRNGSGQYNLLYDWNDDKANGIKVLASRMQAQEQDMADAIGGSLAADGQKVLTGNLDFNENKAVNLAKGTALGDSINVSQGQTGELQYYGISATTPLGTDGLNYDVSPPASLTTYPSYVKFSFNCHSTCKDNPIMRFGSLATKNLKKSDGAGGYTALVARDMVVDKEYIGVYNEDISNADIIIGVSVGATTSIKGISYLYQPITIANNASDANNDIDFSAGNFNSSDGSGQAVASALTKRLDAAWAAGTNQGGLFSGSKANSTWYHCFAIYNPTTGISDAGFDTSVTAANIPFGYTKYKRVGSIRTDGSGNILAFIQNGNQFSWVTIIEDINTTTTTSATLRTLSTPLNLRVKSLLNVYLSSAAAAGGSTLLISDPSTTNSDPSTISNATANNSASFFVDHADHQVMTNTSSQVRTRCNVATANLIIRTYGWIDYQL